MSVSITDFVIRDAYYVSLMSCQVLYNFLNHISLFGHFSFFLESIEILKLFVAKIITL